jgi:hypothetical protein
MELLFSGAPLSALPLQGLAGRPTGKLASTGSTSQAEPEKRLQDLRKASKSSLIWSLRVEHMPLGAPGYRYEIHGGSPFHKISSTFAASATELII